MLIKIKIISLTEFWIPSDELPYSFIKKKSDSWLKDVRWNQEISKYTSMEKNCCLEDKNILFHFFFF